MFKYLMKAAMTGPTTLLHCRKRAYNTRDLPYVYYVKYNLYNKMLMEELAMKEKDSKALLFTNQKIFDIPLNQLLEQCRLCQDWRINMRTIQGNPDLLYWSKRTLEDRIMFLRDMGVKKLDAEMVSRFLTVIDMPMTIFKAHMKIPRRRVIATRLLEILHEKPAGVAPLKAPSDNLTVKQYHNHCLQWYLQWRLDIPMDDVEQIKGVMMNLRTKSLTIIRRMFDILHREIGFTIDEIKLNRSLGAGSPNELSRIIDRIPFYYGTDIKRLIRTQPQLVRMQYSNVVELMNVFDKHNLSEAAKKCYPMILVQRAHRVADRLTRLEKTPELRVLKRSAHALFLIRRPDRTAIRLSYLRLMNMPYATVNCLTNPRFDFEGFVRTGKDKTKLMEVGNAFEEILRLEANEIRRRIQKHPNWRRIDLLSIYNTIEYLLKYYDPEDLHDSLTLILYPRKRIAEVLHEILTSEPATDEEKRLRYSPKYVLAMCLYMIESEHHFSGDGVWKVEGPFTRRIGPPGDSDEEPADYSSDEDQESEVVVDSPAATSQCN